ncbi:MAG: hypothetical protein UMR38_08240 [Candidatus Izemoplasma sp.]|nr:hypothetical protein [Candidatus Izemoplasma sp.]
MEWKEVTMCFCKLLPEPYDYHSYETEEEFMSDIYDYFQRTLFNNKIIFKTKPVFFFVRPLEEDREQGFYHITTYGKKGSRTLDVYRATRINWIKPIIDNYNCTFKCCEGILNWVNPETKREHIYMVEDRFVIVLKEKRNVFELITAFYVPESNTRQHKKYLEDYFKYG